MKIQDVLRCKQKSLDYLDLETPLDQVEKLIKAWSDCALKIVSNFPPNSAAYLMAVELSEAAASQIYDDALENKRVYVLVKCAKHLNLADKLYSNAHPLVRAACAVHEHLAAKLHTDADEYVRAACCQWVDIAEALEDDQSPVVRSAQILKSEKLALLYFKQGNMEEIILCSKRWASCAKLLLKSGDRNLINFAHHQLGLMGAQP